MIETQVATINGKPLVCKQSVTIEEKASIKSGLPIYWEYDGKKIYSPGEIVNLLTQHAASGQTHLTALTNPKVIKDHYQRLKDSQHKLMIEHFDKTIEEYKNNPSLPEEVRKNIVKQIEEKKKMFSGMYPGQDGLFRPTIDQAEKMLGKDVLNNFTDEQKKQIFNKNN